MKTSSIAIVLLVCFSFIASACQPEDDPLPYQSNPLLEIDIKPWTLTGKTTGTASAVYSLPEGTVVCSDEAATYEMTLSKDNKAPSDTLLTSDPPGDKLYFSVDINAVMRILDKGKCLERDASDDRVHLKIEGYYDGSNYKFTPLTCSKTSSISNSEIYYTSELVAKGDIECDYSEQMKYIFHFADLKLK
jgi:hypothetical protein